MTILLFTLGSAGDVHPFIGLGLALQKRGHRVKVLTNPAFESLVQKVGLEFVPLGTEAEFNQLRDNPDLWHLTKAFKTVFNAVLDGLRPAFDAIMAHHVADETVVVASSLGLAARVAQDRYAIPVATVHLAPAVLRSMIDSPVLPGLPLPAVAPRWLKRAIFAIADALLIDRLMAPRLNEFRAELGLPPVKRILNQWWNSPTRVIGLFPAWFAPPPADWPPQLRLTGFPLYDESDVSALSPALVDFLDRGELPIIFTAGSAMVHAHDFFQQSLDACRKLNRRGILLTRHPRQIPADLPATVIHVDYAPLSKLLPRAAAFVHHGGIGTSAQAMKSGIRQLVMPFCHDQLDNAARLKRLGVARVINRSRYRANRTAEMLKSILGDQTMGQHCAEVAERFDGVDPIGQTCELIEAMLPTQ